MNKGSKYINLLAKNIENRKVGFRIIKYFFKTSLF